VAPDGDIRAYAGGGILAASDPEVELAETKLKFRPMVEAFG
jgi:menaquinone-specific isochorismate synthase